MDIRKENELNRQIDLLCWKEITTNRQEKNGTRIFQLPIKKYGQFIEVGSFESGYVRRMNGCYTPYQLNKCENYDHFYKEFKTHYSKNGDYHQTPTGKYNKHVCRRRLLIPNEVDRIEYLITYCLKNYYINQANMIENGNYITKWKHEWEMKNGSIDKVIELQNELRRNSDLISVQRARIEELEKEIDQISDYNYDKIEGLNQEIDELTVSVNGHRYKVI